MKILVVGGGGREHALVWKLAQSPSTSKILCAPGNAGIAEIADCFSVSPEDIPGLVDLAKKEDVDITVVGPEIPLSNGIVDEFIKEGMQIFGPEKKAAELESSKVFAKDFMHKYDIPTAKYKIFSDAENAKKYIHDANSIPCVIKADGLAEGKGVIVARDKETALSAIESIMVERIFGNAGDKIIIEECLDGEEVSILAFTDGKSVYPMLPAQDHKQVYDRDKGPNTGGMGAYCPTPVCTTGLQQKVLEEILIPTVKGVRAEGHNYKGILYAGLMITKSGPKVLEYNVRFGDPEAQPLIKMLETDLVTVIKGIINENLQDIEIKWKEGACVSVVIASGGYPGKYKKNLHIQGLRAVPCNVEVFHAGTSLKDGEIVTAGGRVLNVIAEGSDLNEAVENVYRGIKAIYFENMYYRTDIGRKAIPGSK
ncbi:MAG: phosphoribosylamine--glycine ligase [Clostridiales bacterium]|nr:phosphoribosylamine--glycine ligase [Clostridiales bacterium]MCF8021682.1 phosphoribosylamine--glycine ligase [Clostridiales bacterium]